MTDEELRDELYELISDNVYADHDGEYGSSVWVDGISFAVDDIMTFIKENYGNN